jgi:hypothetical protein
LKNLLEEFKKKKLKVVKMAAIVKVVLFVSVGSEQPREGHTCRAAPLMMWFKGPLLQLLLQMETYEYTIGLLTYLGPLINHKHSQNLSTVGTVRKT